MNSKQITNDLRSKVIEKLQSINSVMMRNTTPEAIESLCFEKADNNQDAYLKLCQTFISNSQKQMNPDVTQNNLATMQHLRPNPTGQSNNGTPSDPINALQNLTVTAGQPNQINMQQTNPQHQMNIRMNTNLFNQQLRQRNLMPVTLQSGNMQRPLEQFPITQSPITQIIQPQMQQVHNMNPLNTNNVRLITKNVVPQSPTMPMTYQIDANNGGQQMPNIVRPPNVRMVSNSPSTLSQQVPLIQNVSQELYSNPKPNAATPINNVPTEESNSQLANNSQPNTVSNVSSNQNVGNNSIITNPNPPSVPPVKVQVSEEESLKVREELMKLSGRYLRYIKLVLKHPDHVIEQNKKVWITLAGVLDDPNGLNKNISMKHVIKIQDFCEKAEKLVQLHNLDDVKPIKDLVVPKSEELFGKRIIPDRNRPTPSSIDTCNITGTPINSLDSAFDDVLHQLKKKDPKMIKTIQKNLVKFVKTSYPKCFHFLPRYLPNQDDENSDNESTKMEPHFDEHEFDYLDDIEIEGLEQRPLKGRNRALDENGMLRTDIDMSLLSSSEFSGLQSELELVYGEFKVETLDEQTRSPTWCTKDDVWEKSSFFSFTVINENLPTQIPSIRLRVPFDYDQGGSVDWDLNLEFYSTVASPNNNHIFLSDVRCAMEDEFADLEGHSNISGVNLLQVLSVFKRSIETGYSNFECRRAMSMI